MIFLKKEATPTTDPNGAKLYSDNGTGALMVRNADSTIAPVAGQPLPFASCDGAGVAINIQNGAFSGIARHSGEAAGVFDLTLVTPVQITGTAGAAHGAYPFASAPRGAANAVRAEAEPIGLSGVPGTITGVKVTLQDATNTKVDGFFELFFHQI